ncbi:MAG: hypothetical protein J6M02_05115 [Clostridia bacterium]|nr:hypothetical protein [Clostridia bacterium]
MKNIWKSRVVRRHIICCIRIIRNDRVWSADLEKGPHFYGLIVRTFYGLIVRTFYGLIVRTFYGLIVRTFYGLIVRTFYDLFTYYGVGASLCGIVVGILVVAEDAEIVVVAVVTGVVIPVVAEMIVVIW